MVKTPCPGCESKFTESIKLGRAHYHCKECDFDKSLIDYYWYEATNKTCAQNNPSKQKNTNSHVEPTAQNDNQQKKDKDDCSSFSLSGGTKQLRRKTNKGEHMSASVDNQVDTDALTKPNGSRIDGRRNPQDNSGVSSGLAKGDTGDGTYPADLKSKTMDEEYGDGSDHKICKACGFCGDCADCDNFGCGAL